MESEQDGKRPYHLDSLPQMCRVTAPSFGGHVCWLQWQQ